MVTVSTPKTRQPAPPRLRRPRVRPWANFSRRSPHSHPSIADFAPTIPADSLALTRGTEHDSRAQQVRRFVQLTTSVQHATIAGAQVPPGAHPGAEPVEPHSVGDRPSTLAKEVDHPLNRREKSRPEHVNARSYLVRIAVSLSLLAALLIASIGWNGASGTIVPTNAIAYGTVSRGGTPVSGADVVAFAWPTVANLAAGTEDTSVGETPVGYAVTDSSGGFEIDANPSLVPAGYMDTEGRVLIQLEIADDTTEMGWFYTARFQNPTPSTPNLWNAEPTTSTAVPSGPDIVADLASSMI